MYRFSLSAAARFVLLVLVRARLAIVCPLLKIPVLSCARHAIKIAVCTGGHGDPGAYENATHDPCDGPSAKVAVVVAAAAATAAQVGKRRSVIWEVSYSKAHVVRQSSYVSDEIRSSSAGVTSSSVAA